VISNRIGVGLKPLLRLFHFFCFFHGLENASMLMA